jgi:hypothetical protein
MYQANNPENVVHFAALFMKDALGHGSNAGGGSSPLKWDQQSRWDHHAVTGHGEYHISPSSGTSGVQKLLYRSTTNRNYQRNTNHKTVEAAKAAAEKHHTNQSSANMSADFEKDALGHGSNSRGGGTPFDSGSGWANRGSHFVPGGTVKKQSMQTNHGEYVIKSVSSHGGGAGQGIYPGHHLHYAANGETKFTNLGHHSSLKKAQAAAEAHHNSPAE